MRTFWRNVFHLLVSGTALTLQCSLVIKPVVAEADQVLPSTGWPRPWEPTVAHLHPSAKMGRHPKTLMFLNISTMSQAMLAYKNWKGFSTAKWGRWSTKTKAQSKMPRCQVQKPRLQWGILCKKAHVPKGQVQQQNKYACLKELHHSTSPPINPEVSLSVGEKRLLEHKLAFSITWSKNKVSALLYWTQPHYIGRNSTGQKGLGLGPNLEGSVTLWFAFVVITAIICWS